MEEIKELKYQVQLLKSDVRRIRKQREEWRARYESISSAKSNNSEIAKLEFENSKLRAENNSSKRKGRKEKKLIEKIRKINRITEGV